MHGNLSGVVLYIGGLQHMRTDLASLGMSILHLGRICSVCALN